MTSHDESPRTSKPSSPSRESDSRVLRGSYGAKELGDPGPFHIKPEAHAKEEEMSKDEQRRFKLPRYVAKDNPVLGKTEITEGRSDTPPKAVSQIIPRESTSATSQLWEYSRGAILG